jgi:hydroxymethylpyrimidine pyrophosphatase-like HAD family hydrolase
MHFVTLVTDYDGTLAEDGKVDPATVDALDALGQSGRKLILVTGRELPDFRRVFSEIGRFDLVIAENGALLYQPATGCETTLAGAPPPVFIDRLRAHHISPLSVGRSIVANLGPNEKLEGMPHYKASFCRPRSGWCERAFDAAALCGLAS